MAAITPFHGVRYTDKAGPLASVVAPPYDVISPAEQQELCARSPHNIVHLILDPQRPDDDDANNRYTRAAQRLKTWLAEGQLAPDPQPAIYVYDQEFDVGGQRLRRRGVLSAIKLEELGQGTVYPHENTLAGPKADRLKLMTACEGDLSPVFGLYPDEDGAAAAELGQIVDQAEHAGAQAIVVDTGDCLHRLLPLTNPPAIERVQRLLAPKPLFIADGHHRYETALAYRAKRMKERGAADGADHVLMMAVSMADPGLVVLPTHRVVRNVPGLSPEALKAAAGPWFDVEDIPPEAARDCKPDRRRIVAYFGKGRGALALRLKSEDAAVAPGSDMSRTWCLLDVSLLRNLVFGEMLKLDVDNFAQSDDIAYVHQTPEALRLVDQESWSAAFLLAPTEVAEVENVATAGERMPPKSTYFHPKLLTGLVLYLFDARG